MVMLTRFAALGIVLFFIPGCATAIRGTSQIVVISSEPSGAMVSIDSAEKHTAPAIVSLKRKSAHTIGVTMDGYAAQTQTISTDAEYKLVALNLLLGHPAVAAAGTGVDIFTGAYKRLTPQVINFQLAITDSLGLARRKDVAWQPVPIGSRIRVAAADSGRRAVVGTLVAVSGDTLIVESAAATVASRISRSAVATIELSLGQDRQRGMRRWLGRGTLAGIAVGAAVGAIAHGAEGAIYWSLLFGAPGGLVLGTVAGAVVATDDIWLRIR